VFNKRKRLSENTRDTKAKARSLDLDLDGHLDALDARCR
jgi:hypothetical protein